MECATAGHRIVVESTVAKAEVGMLGDSHRYDVIDTVLVLPCTLRTLELDPGAATLFLVLGGPLRQAEGKELLLLRRTLQKVPDEFLDEPRLIVPEQLLPG